MRRIVLIFIIGIVLPTLTSCRAISSCLSKEEAVAEVGSARLYRSDLNMVIPKGLAYEDSVRLAKSYINTWALDQVFLSIAEQQLSKSEKDVTRELEDYRTSLLKFRYEQLYVNERLDTAVSDDKVEEYYQAHMDKFILRRPLVKARFLKISAESPTLKELKKKMSSEEVNDLFEADSLAYSSALKFEIWQNNWVDIALVASELGMDYTSVLASMKGKWVERTDTTGIMTVAYISEIISEGHAAPIEYSTPSIKDMIISARKQQLVSTLERDLLNEARENGQFVILK